MSLSGIVEMTLEARDVESMARWYRERLGLELLSEEDDRVWLAIGERGRLGIWSPGEKEFGDEGGRHVHFALSAAPGTLDDLSQRLRDAGEDPRGPEEHEGGDRSLYVEDPEGNVLEVWDFFERGEGARDGVDALK